MVCRRGLRRELWWEARFDGHSGIKVFETSFGDRTWAALEEAQIKGK